MPTTRETIRARSARLASALVVSATLLAVPASAIATETPPGDDGGASQHGSTRQVSCSILTPNIAPGTVQTTGRFRVTPSGNATLVCHGKVAHAPDHAIVLRGLACPTPLGTTNRSHTVITPSGNVTLVCHVKAKGGKHHGRRAKPKQAERHADHADDEHADHADHADDERGEEHAAGAGKEKDD